MKLSEHNIIYCIVDLRKIITLLASSKEEQLDYLKKIRDLPFS